MAEAVPEGPQLEPSHVAPVVEGPKPLILKLDIDGGHEEMIAFLCAWSKDVDWEGHFKGINVTDLMRFSADDLVAILGPAIGRALFNRLEDLKGGFVASKSHCPEGPMNKRPKMDDGSHNHQLVTAPTFTGVWRSGQWTTTKQKYQKHTCSGKDCRQRIRTHCSCDPSRFWCAGCFYEQHKMV
jgi:hypothetical protein